MKEFVWLSRTEVLAFHDEQLHEHGGLPGVRDENALESALGRPPNISHCENFVLAAAYAYGMAKNHPFSDGNKRTAFVCAAVFLGLNGIELSITEPMAVEMMLGLASGKIGQEEVAAVLRQNSATSEGGNS